MSILIVIDTYITLINYEIKTSGLFKYLYYRKFPMRQYLTNYYYPITMIIIIFVLPFFLFVSSIYGMPIYFLSVLVSILQYVIFIIMLFIYPFWTLIYPTSKYFEKISNRNAVLEYEALKKIAYLLFPFFIFGTFYLITDHIMKTSLISNLKLPEEVTLLVGVLFFIVASVFLKLLLLNAKKDLGFIMQKLVYVIFQKTKKMQQIR